jgi:hypothetical protein
MVCLMSYPVTVLWPGYKCLSSVEENEYISNDVVDDQIRERAGVMSSKRCFARIVYSGCRTSALPAVRSVHKISTEESLPSSSQQHFITAPTENEVCISLPCYLSPSSKNYWAEGSCSKPPLRQSCCRPKLQR